MIGPVMELLTAYRPHFARADYRLVQTWLDAGCDLEQDILHVLREQIGKKDDIYSLGFFTRHVYAAHAERTKVHRKAQAIAFITRRLNQRHPYEERWLAGYEAAFGPVTLTCKNVPARCK